MVGKVYIKIHCYQEYETIACCDEKLLNQVFKEGNLRIEISEQFFGGKLVQIEEAMKLLRDASSFNIVGENVIDEAIAKNLLPKDGVRIINGVPMAMKMML
ncbi:MAG: DUF424 family protein [Candidatus Lokiarchaeota archaeon]|nr:DUF424 family protein [Candidatus Lokiarchaeota archaeon]